MNPYEIIIHRLVTEKSRVLETLQSSQSNPSVARCKAPKAVFRVHAKATKPQIAQALEIIYAEKKLRVVSVNTIQVKPKKKRVRGRSGMTSGFKKAIITFRPGDVIEEQV